ncbi:MAG: hypothetical protein ACXVX9_05670 [Mycobacteriaceae bacterium]
MRYTFGGQVSDNVIQSPSANGNAVKVLPNQTGGTAWSAQSGGSNYGDLLPIGTDPAPVCTDSDGFVRPFQGPDGIQTLWVDFGGTRRLLKGREVGTSVDVGLDGRYETGSTTILYVSTTGNDANNGKTWGTAKATIAAALTALGSNAGDIMLGGAGSSFSVNAADAYGNGITLTHPGQRIIGRGSNQTTIVINANVTWGIELQAQFTQLTGVYVTIPSGKTVSYGAGVSTPTSSGSAEFGSLTDVFVNCAGTVTAAFACGPDWPGSSSVDVADTMFTACVFNGAPTHGYLFGNGTSGNVLMPHLYGCGGSGAQYGVTLAGCGLTWHGGGLSNITVADIHITQGTTDTVLLSGVRCENGKRFLDVGYIGGITGGVNLVDCIVGSYTPSDNIVIQYNSYSPLNIIGGYYDGGAGSLIVVNSAGGSPAIPLTAIGVHLVNQNGWPAKNTARVIRTILNASYSNAGVATPNPSFGAVLDAANPAPTMAEVDATGSLTLTGTAQDIPGATVTFTPTVAGKLLVIGTFDFSCTVAGEILAGYLNVDGTALTQDALMAGSINRLTVTRHWTVSLTAASHTIKLQASRLSGTGTTHSTNATHTGFSYQFIPAAN